MCCHGVCVCVGGGGGINLHYNDFNPFVKGEI